MRKDKEKDKEKEREYNRQYYLANKEKLKRYIDENREKVNAYNKQWQKDHKECQERQRAKRYGLSVDGLRLLLEQSSDTCPICQNKFDDTKHSKKKNVDHCHKTGTVRGIICTKCNQGLGSFKDNVESLKNAIKYLDNGNSAASPFFKVQSL